VLLVLLHQLKQQETLVACQLTTLWRTTLFLHSLFEFIYLSVCLSACKSVCLSEKHLNENLKIHIFWPSTDNFLDTCQNEAETINYFYLRPVDPCQLY